MVPHSQPALDRPTLSFWKMQGLGNDFLVVDARRGDPAERNWPDLARRWCDRHFGVGADGILLIVPSHRAIAGMRTFNADGSEAQMCGNGIRCVARYLYETSEDRKIGRRQRGPSRPTSDVRHPTILSIETPAGILETGLILQNGTVMGVRVDMGEPRFRREDIPMAGDPERLPQREKLDVDGTEFTFSAVSLGNPHCVIVVEDLEAVDLKRFGPAIEYHPLFPQRTNVEFAQVLSPHHVRVAVWERGAGLTLACGTGACGVVAITSTLGLTGRRARVSLPGGGLDIEWMPDGHLYMTGPAEAIFAGTVPLP